MKNDLPVDELKALQQLEDDAEHLEERKAEVDEQMELLEARVRAARLAGA